MQERLRAISSLSLLNTAVDWARVQFLDASHQLMRLDLTGGLKRRKGRSRGRRRQEEDDR